MATQRGLVPLSALSGGDQFLDKLGRRWRKYASLQRTHICELTTNKSGSSGLVEFPFDWRVQPAEDVRARCAYILSSGGADEYRIDHVLMGPPGLDLGTLRKEFAVHFQEQLRGLRKTADREAKAQELWGPFDTNNRFDLDTNAFLEWLGNEHECWPVFWVEELL